MPIVLNDEKNYLHMIKNSVGSNMFRNLYVIDEQGNQFDATENGNKSCAIYVTAILKLFDKIDRLHSTASGTYKYISSSINWSKTDKPIMGDLVFWDKTDSSTGHVGFFLDNNTAISNIDSTGNPQNHMLTMHDGRKPLSFWTYLK